MTTIETGVEMPPEKKEKKPSTRARKAAASSGTKKTPNPAASLIAALKFIAPAQRKVGPVPSQFAHINGHWACASDGVLTIGHPIEEDLSACPQTMQFIDALSKATSDLSITQLSQNTLSVSSGAFRALVPCVSFDEVPILSPDPQCAVVHDGLKTALGAVAGLANENSPHAHMAGVLLQAGSTVATNGAVILEAWHGIDLPPALLMPKGAAVAVAKASPALTGFGFSQSSVTFYFENGAFIKTQLFGERYPAYETVLNVEGLNPWAVPDEFFAAVKAVESFSDNGSIYFEDGAISSTMVREQASTYKIDGLPERMGFNSKLLLSVEHAFKKAHFMDNPSRVYFFGEQMRGCVMGLDIPREREQTSQSVTDYEDDIPF